MSVIERPSQAHMAIFAVRMGIGLGLTPDETAEAIRPGDAAADRLIGDLITHTITGEANADLLDETADVLSGKAT